MLFSFEMTSVFTDCFYKTAVDNIFRIHDIAVLLLLLWDGLSCVRKIDGFYVHFSDKWFELDVNEYQHRPQIKDPVQG